MAIDNVTINLSGDEALVLFEFLHRYGETDALGTVDQAEQRALWNLLALLERELVEPLAPNYMEALAAARVRLRDQE